MTNNTRGCWRLLGVVRKGQYLEETQLRVVAADIQDAVDEWYRQHPDAELWSVGRRSKVDVITNAAAAGYIAP